MGTKKNPVRKTVDVHESTVKNAAAISKQAQAGKRTEGRRRTTMQPGLQDFKDQMSQLAKAGSKASKVLNKKYSMVEVVKLHPLILAFIKDHGLKCSDFIVEGPESIILKEKWDV